MRELERHLQPLMRNGEISRWHDGCIEAGQEWESQIKANLSKAQIILLLISVDFINSDYCYSVELTEAIERHQAGNACVIPVILRSCMWKNVRVSSMRLGELQALPKDARPLSKWDDRDEAYTSIAEGILSTITQLKQKQEQAEHKDKLQHYEQEFGKAENRQREAEDDLSSEKGIDYHKLQQLLKAGDWKAADQETYEVMIRALGKKPGDYFTREELLNFPCQDLRTIDTLWVKYSQGRFGFSVQKQIYVECGAKLDGQYPGGKIWREFSVRVGWRVDVSWIRYSQVTFSTSASRGHLPEKVHLNHKWDWRWGKIKGYSSLLSHIETCKV